MRRRGGYDWKYYGLWIEKPIIYIRFIFEINLDIYYWRVNVKSFVSEKKV